MSESPIELRGKGGGVVFQGTQSPGGGSSPYEQVRVALAFDTPGFVIPASGPVGIPLFSLAAGDMLSFAGGNNWMLGSVPTIFDGTNPTFRVIGGGGQRGNMPGTPPSYIESQDLTLADADAGNDVETGKLFVVANNLNTLNGQAAPGGGRPSSLIAAAPLTFYGYYEDGANGDPGSSQGELTVIVSILRAP